MDLNIQSMKMRLCRASQGKNSEKLSLSKGIGIHFVKMSCLGTNNVFFFLCDFQEVKRMRGGGEIAQQLKIRLTTKEARERPSL